MGSNLYIPGEVGSIARQFMRCILHQLTPNKVFIQLFQTQMPDPMRLTFFKTMAQALTDFNELSPVAPLQFLLETLNQQVFMNCMFYGLANDSKRILRRPCCYFHTSPSVFIGFFFSHRKAASYDSFCIFTSFQMKPGLQVQIWIHYEFSYLPSHSIIYTVDVVD